LAPSFILRTNELLHAHVGYFDKAASFDRGKRLINLNIDAVDLAEAAGAKKPSGGPGIRSVGIYSMAQETFVREASPGTYVDAQSTLGTLHTILKDVLADVIAPDMAERIRLNSVDVS
jgi:hypothetical protein